MRSCSTSLTVDRTLCRGGLTSVRGTLVLVPAGRGELENDFLSIFTRLIDYLLGLDLFVSEGVNDLIIF